MAIPNDRRVGRKSAPFVLVVDQSGEVVQVRGEYRQLVGHTVEDLSARFAEGLRA